MPVQTASIMKTEKMIVKDEDDNPRVLKPEERTLLLNDMQGKGKISYPARMPCSQIQTQSLSSISRRGNRQNTFRFEFGRPACVVLIRFGPCSARHWYCRTEAPL